jgi:hypothetical protein
MASIYISSTYSDLKEYRDTVYRTLRQMRQDVIAMEDYVATDQRPLAKCLADVAACDIYVGIFAWRYGYSPTKENPEGKSITELEFRHAAANKKTCLIFLLAEDYPWPPSLMEKGEASNRLQALRAELSTDYTVSFFGAKEDLARLVSIAVNACVQEQSRRPYSSASRSEPNLGSLVFKLCDRSRQIGEFRNFFISNMNRRPGVPQMYLVRGAEKECHDSLVERLVHAEIKPLTEKRWGEQKGVVTHKKMGWAYEGELPELQQEMTRMLFAEFDPLYMDEDLSATAFNRKVSLFKSPVIVIQHSLHAKMWGKLTKELIEWHMKYWADIANGPSGPQYLVFINVIYPKAQAGGWLKIMLGQKRFNKDRIEKEMRALVDWRGRDFPCLLLRELSPVKQEEVKDWFSLNNILSERKRYELIAEIFKSADGQDLESMSMADIEHELQIIIESLQHDIMRARGF